MTTIEREIIVEAPLATVYNQWTQFEEFPRFMDGVETVRQTDDRHVWWRADVAGRIEEWEAEIDEQRPDERIAWHSVSGREIRGTTDFKPAGEDRTRIHIVIEYEPQSWAEEVAEPLGLAGHRVHDDLEHFKEFLEERGHETGAWRGEIEPVGQDYEDAERAAAEERQRAPGGGSPGGQAAIDPATGRPRNRRAE